MMLRIIRKKQMVFPVDQNDYVDTICAHMTSVMDAEELLVDVTHLVTTVMSTKIVLI